MSCQFYEVILPYWRPRTRTRTMINDRRHAGKKCDSVTMDARLLRIENNASSIQAGLSMVSNEVSKLHSGAITMMSSFSI